MVPAQCASHDRTPASGGHPDVRVDRSSTTPGASVDHASGLRHSLAFHIAAVVALEVRLVDGTV